MQDSGTAAGQKREAYKGPRLQVPFEIEGWKQWRELLPPALRFPAGTQLFEQGEPTPEVFLIESGLAKLLQRNADGDETILGLRFPGWFLGAAPLLLNCPSPAAAVILTPCYLRRISAVEFTKLILDCPAFSFFLHQVQSLEIIEQLNLSAGLAHHTARQRLEDLMWRPVTIVEAVGTTEGTRLRLPLKQNEIAQLLAVSPSYLCKLLHQTEADGVLLRKNGWLVVPDRNRLWHPNSEQQ